MKNILFLIIVLFLSAPLFAQDENFNIFGAGARAAGMGSAFIGLADDATAISWNPAGLVQLVRPEISVVGKLNFAQYNFDYPYNPAQNTYQSNNFANFLFGSIVYPVKVSDNQFSFGVCYQKVTDNYYDYTFPNHSSKRTGGLSTLSGSASVSLGSVFSIGFTTNYWLGGGSFTYTNIDPTQNYSNNITKISGINFIIGTLFDFSSLNFPMKLGLTAKTPFTLKHDYTYTDPTEVFDYYDNISMPVMIGCGVSFRVNDNLLLAADYEYRAWKNKTDVLGLKDSYSQVISNMSDMNENLNQFRVGLEYSIIARNLVIPLRIGYRNDPTLEASSSVNNNVTTYDKTEIGDILTFGIGASFARLSVDAAYEYRISKDRKRNFDLSEYSYDYTAKYNNFMLSTIVYF